MLLLWHNYLIETNTIFLISSPAFFPYSVLPNKNCETVNRRKKSNVYYLVKP